MLECFITVLPEISMRSFLFSKGGQAASGGACPKVAKHRGNGRPARLETEPVATPAPHTGETPMPLGKSQKLQLSGLRRKKMPLSFLKKLLTV
jgi:hypothetical protein